MTISGGGGGQWALSLAIANECGVENWAFTASLEALEVSFQLRGQSTACWAREAMSVVGNDMG
jgi:hypothetical protein